MPLEVVYQTWTTSIANTNLTLVFHGNASYMFSLTYDCGSSIYDVFVGALFSMKFTLKVLRHGNLRYT